MKHFLLSKTLLFVSAVIFQTTINAQNNNYSNTGRVFAMPNRTTLSISGVKKQNAVEIKGILSSSHSYDRIIFERTSAPGSFSYIGEMDISGTAASTFPFTYLDEKPDNGVNYYRIRLVSSSRNIQEISNTLMVKTVIDQEDLEVINTLLPGGNPVISIRSLEDKEADLQLVDMLSGRIVHNSKTRLNNGFNNINLQGINYGKGYFMLMVRTEKNSINRKIMIQ